MTTITDLLAGPLTSTALCWRIGRRDGVVLGFTNHDRDVIIDGQRYLATPSFTPSALVMSAGFSVDTIELAGVLSHAAIQASDLSAGRFDGAEIRVFMVDWSQPDVGSVALSSGYFGTVREEDQKFSVEVRGLTDALEAPVVELYSPECRAELGDQRCRVNLQLYKFSSIITKIIDSQTFQVTAPGSGSFLYSDYLAYGRVRWLSGHNDSADGEILTSGLANANLQIGLRSPPRLVMQVGDRLEITAGCDKRQDSCINKFYNRLNFRGEPFVPGIDSLVRYPNG